MHQRSSQASTRAIPWQHFRATVTQTVLSQAKFSESHALRQSCGHGFCTIGAYAAWIQADFVYIWAPAGQSGCTHDELKDIRAHFWRLDWATFCRYLYFSREFLHPLRCFFNVFDGPACSVTKGKKIRFDRIKMYAFAKHRHMQPWVQVLWSAIDTFCLKKKQQLLRVNCQHTCIRNVVKKSI